MKKMILSILMFTLGSVIGTVAWANSSPSKSDGCGLGWEVTKEHTMIATTTRGTTNSVVPPTFGMTSGTIGCEKLDIAAHEVDKASYAVTNFEGLKLEMAMGQGETLNGFSKIMGCGDAQAFAQMTKKNYQNIYASSETTPVEMYKSVRALTQAHCSAI